jgi:hypothetical protein
MTPLVQPMHFTAPLGPRERPADKHRSAAFGLRFNAESIEKPQAPRTGAKPAERTDT